MEGRPNYQSAMRKEKLDTIELVVERCSNSGLPALKKELYGFALMRWGTEWRKFMEYLNDLVMLKIIHIDGNECWSADRWNKIKNARERDYLRMRDIINR